MLGMHKAVYEILTSHELPEEESWQERLLGTGYMPGSLGS